VAQVLEALCYKPEGHDSDFQWCHWNFSLSQSFQANYDPEVDAASKRRE